ncbi:MAG TPA: cytochrome c3 family protein [Kofleriaceae bacterium]|nr:cytochrome c3 family protein [Kofleriaceae bacterium]
MRAAVLVLVLLLAGFDHAKHATATEQALACTTCHTGKLGHATCFGACHGPVPARGKPVVDPERAPVCASCHTGAALDTGDKRLLRVIQPSHADFTLAIGHKRHAQVACVQCHPAKPPRVHGRCAGCHVGTPGKGPPMGLCTTCHVDADPLGPAPESRVRVRRAFSHPKHAARGAKCAACHLGATETDARELPHATKATCATGGCHDGKIAFPTTDACTRCHQDVPTMKFTVARPDKAFSHTLHLPYVALVACSTCHPVERSGEVGLARHAQCASCHAADFASRTPETCGACHDATEPWRKLLPDRPSRPRTEFGASLDHAKHARSCESCHSLATESAQKRPPRGHRACTGNGCHATSGGVVPRFTECVGCHELGLAEQRIAQRTTAPWSVRARFIHAKHPGTCTSCHVDTTGREVLSIAAPPKATCVPCHDGQTSFKVTGTGCTRCHPSK